MKGQIILTAQLANVLHAQKRTQTHMHTRARADIHTRPLHNNISLQKRAEQIISH